MVPTTLAYLTCLCGAISAPGSLLSDQEIPLSMEICHCNFCRRTTGSLGTVSPSLRAPPPDNLLVKLTGYSSSSKSTIYFCSKCGCHGFIITHKRGEWFCTGGIIEPSPSSDAENDAWPGNIIKVIRHDFVLDTVDGGMVPLLLNLSGRSNAAWSAAAQPYPETPSDLPHETVLALPASSSETVPPPKENEYLQAECHCGGVSLLIKRANYSEKMEHGTAARYITPDPTKYMAYLCACRSCRLSTGVSLMAYALIPTSNVFEANSSASPDPQGNSLSPVTYGYDSTANPGQTLKHYWSSPDVCRSFCGKCGATIFYWCAKRPDELDVAVGILRAEEGSMARRWLYWEWGRSSFEEECVDRELLEAWQGCMEVMKIKNVD